MRSATIGRGILVAALAVGGFAVGGTALGKGGGGEGGGGGGGTPISTAGVLAVGVGGGTQVGTYVVTPTGSYLRQLTTQIYPTDISRCGGVVTVLSQFGTGLPRYAANSSIFARRADGTGVERDILSSTDPHPVSFPVFSRDGSSIGYVSVDASVSPVVGRIYVGSVVRDVAGDVVGLTGITQVYSTTTPIFPQAIDFSRDGSKIAFTTSSDLWTLTIATGATQRLTNTSAQEAYPRWSPVDDRIAYEVTATAGSAIAGIQTIDAVTGALRTVLSGTSNTYAHVPVWSPDATNLLVVASGKNSFPHLAQVPSTGGSLTHLTNDVNRQETRAVWGW